MSCGYIGAGYKNSHDLNQWSICGFDIVEKGMLRDCFVSRTLEPVFCWKNEITNLLLAITSRDLLAY